jgi:hypothetical protein
MRDAVDNPPNLRIDVDEAFRLILDRLRGFVFSGETD